jgi:hypothetical protein
MRVIELDKPTVRPTAVGSRSQLAHEKQNKLDQSPTEDLAKSWVNSTLDGNLSNTENQILPVSRASSQLP